MQDAMDIVKIDDENNMSRSLNFYKNINETRNSSMERALIRERTVHWSTLEHATLMVLFGIVNPKMDLTRRPVTD